MIVASGVVPFVAEPRVSRRPTELVNAQKVLSEIGATGKPFLAHVTTVSFGLLLFSCLDDEALRVTFVAAPASDDTKAVNFDSMFEIK